MIRGIMEGCQKGGEVGGEVQLHEESVSCSMGGGGEGDRCVRRVYQDERLTGEGFH